VTTTCTGKDENCSRARGPGFASAAAACAPFQKDPDDGSEGCVTGSRLFTDFRQWTEENTEARVCHAPLTGVGQSEPPESIHGRLSETPLGYL
jgi:hypothetical protein